MSDPQPAVEAFTRVCRKCSTQSTTSGKFCPNCGNGFERGGAPRVNKNSLIAGVLAVVLIAATTVGFALKNRHDSNAEAARVAAVAKSETARLAAVAKSEAADNAKIKSDADDAERKQRAAWVTALESYIKKDAKKKVGEGILDGPILSGSCTATGGGSTDDLTALTGTFDCMAVNKENKDDTMSGYSYAGTIDWQTGEFTWRLGG